MPTPSPDPARPQAALNVRAPARINQATRWGFLATALALGLVLVLARWVEPDPRGFGTHQQLGLPACTFRTITGRPCPGCGLTTAFAWSARGRLDRAWGANPGGALMAPTCLLAIPWLLAGALTGRPPWLRRLEGPFVVLTVAIVAICLVAWMIRMFHSPPGRALG